MSYTFTRLGTAGSSVTSDMGAGRTETLQPGQSFTTDSPCEMIAFLNGLPASDSNYGEERPGVLDSLQRDAEAAGCLAADQAPPTTPQPPAAAAPPPAAPPPPSEGDSATRQAAPAPTLGGTMEGPPATGNPAPEPATGRPNQTHGGERSQNPPSEADPVDLFSGAFTLVQPDLTVATPLLPLVMIRRHRSGAPYFGPFGWNWDHNHNVYLREMANGDVARWTGQLTEDLFKAAGGGFEPQAGVFQTLERLPGLGTEYRITAAEGLTWHFARPAGWSDAERIPLLRISDRHANSLLYSYDGKNRVSEVRDDGGRLLHFGYGECGLLEAVEDGAGRRIDYLHDPDIENLVEVRLPATPDQPDGVRRFYAYGALSAHPWLRHSVARVIDNEGNTIVENTYGEDPASHCFARVTQQISNDYLWQYSYTQLQVVPPSPLFVNLPASRTEVMEPDLGVTTHTFNYRGDVIDVRRRLVQDRSFRVVAFLHEYDVQGSRVRTLYPDGGEELYTFDPANPDPRMRGRLLRHEMTARAGFPSPSRIVWRGEYEPAFQLLRREFDGAGSETHHRYDFDIAPGPNATGRLAESHHPDAVLPDGAVQTAITRFESNARGQVTAMTSPTGIRSEIEHGSVGPLDGFVRLRRYDAGVAAIEWHYGYDALGRCETVVGPSGAERKMLHDPLDRTVEFQAPNVGGARAVVRVRYDATGAPVGLDRPLGEFAEPGFGAAALEDRFERDLAGNLALSTYAANTAMPCSVRICHDHRGNPVRSVDPMGLVVSMQFDERGLPLGQKAFDADNQTVLAATRRVYDLVGRVTQLIEGPDEARTTLFEHDAFGRPTRITLPNGSQQRMVWDHMDQVSEERVEGDDGAGNVRLLSRRRYDYDARGRMIQLNESRFEGTPALSQDLVTRFFHDADGRLEQIVDPRGEVRRFEHDGLGRLTRIISASGEELRIERDDVAMTERRMRRFMENGAIQERTEIRRHDSRGRLISHSDANGNEFRTEWDDRDLPVREIDPEGIERDRSFGALGELLTDAVAPSTLAIRNRWEYDERRNPVRYEDPVGAVTTTGYDYLGRAASITYPDGSARSLQYGTSGSLAQEQMADGTIVSHSYDQAGRLIEMNTAGGTGVPVGTHRYTYDGLDRLVRAELGASVVTRDYDSLSRLIAEQRDGVSLAMSLDDLTGTAERHWPDGRRERITSDPDGRPTRVDRIAGGALGSGAPVLAELTPRFEQQLAAARLLGTVDQSLEYDLSDRPTRAAFTRGGVTLDGTLASYDANNLRRVAVRLGPQSDARVHSYDENGRLTTTAAGFAPPAPMSLASQAQQDGFNAAVAAAAGAGATHRLGFSYSAADERLQKTETGVAPTAYAYAADHALTNDGGAAVVHDVNRVRAQDGARVFGADALGRVVRVEDGAGTVLAKIGYDALGRIARIAEGGGAATELHRFGPELWLERRAGADLRQHTPMPFGRGSLALHDAGRTLLCLQDLRGSLGAICDETGLALEYFDYAPFGTPRILAPDGSVRAISSVGQEPQFGGMRWLPHAGLYLAGPRMMDPQSGVFLSRDPRGYAAGPNLYVYAGQDPVNLIDPDGEFAFLAVLAVMAVGAVLAGGLNAARQGIQIAEGSRSEFSWGELGLSVGIGAVAAPILVVAPELAVPLVALGLANGASEISRGNYATGTFDLVTSLAPFGFKGPRNATFGRGSAFGPRRLGPVTGRAERLGRFTEIDANLRLLGSNLWNRRFYRGTTYYEAEQAVGEQLIDLDTVFGRQRAAAAPPRLGTGLYFTEALEPPAQGSAPYWADLHGGTGRGGGPAVLEGSIPRWRWWSIQRRPNVVSGVEQPNYSGPSTLETFVPEAVAPQFNQGATWTNLPEPFSAPQPPNFTPLWPTLFTPTYRAPDAAAAAEPGGNNGGSAREGK